MIKNIEVCKNRFKECCSECYSVVVEVRNTSKLLDPNKNFIKLQWVTPQVPSTNSVYLLSYDDSILDDVTKTLKDCDLGCGICGCIVDYIDSNPGAAFVLADICPSGYFVGSPV